MEETSGIKMLGILIDEIRGKVGVGWLTSLVIGIAIGFAAGRLFSKKQLDTAEQQVRLSESQRDHAKDQQKQAEAKLAELGQIANTTQSCEATKTIITTQQSEISTLATWNEQWRAASRRHRRRRLN